MSRPVYEPTTQRQIRKQGFSADQLFRRPSTVSASDFITDACLAPPGTLVRPGFQQTGGLPRQLSLQPKITFPAGVIVASLTDYVDEDIATANTRRGGPSRNASAISLATPGNDGNGGTSFDDPDNPHAWRFRPVDDLGLLAGRSYGIFFSWLLFKDGSGNDFHLEWRSESALAAGSNLLWINGGNRLHNVNTTPDTMRWGDESNGFEFQELSYYAMHPVGGNELYGDWPFQTNAVQGCTGLCEDSLAFAEGEFVQIKPWIDGGGGLDAAFYLDHMVFMPKFPLGVNASADVDIGDNDKNFQSSALTAFGYEPTSAPASITNPTDNGQWFPGDTVDDTQALDFITTMPYMTICGHDESDALGLYSGGGSGAHIYVLCRITGEEGTGTPPVWGSNTTRQGGHATCFTGAQSLADIFPDENSAWCWGYAGRMPLGDTPQGAFGVNLWLTSTTGNEEFFFEQFDIPASVRVAFIAYLPAAPCEVGGRLREFT